MKLKNSKGQEKSQSKSKGIGVEQSMETYCNSFNFVALPMPAMVVRFVAESCNISRWGGFPTLSNFNERPSLPRMFNFSRYGSSKKRADTLEGSSVKRELLSNLISVTPLSSVALSHVMPYHEQIGSSEDQCVSIDAPESQFDSSLRETSHRHRFNSVKD